LSGKKVFYPNNSISSNFGFTISFWAGLAAGFLLGILASYLGNYFWEKHKKKKRGTAPYFSANVVSGQIQIEGQFPASETGQNALIETFKASIPPQEQR